MISVIVDPADYPTQQIGKNSHLYRPLGLGYANLGALLMSLGLPYDSDDARALAAGITAKMTGEAYRMSALMAKQRGPFDGFAENREPFLEVLQRHRAAASQLAPSPLRDSALESFIERFDDDNDR